MQWAQTKDMGEAMLASEGTVAARSRRFRAGLGMARLAGRLAMALLALAPLMACGFQLRAWQLDGVFHVEGEDAPALVRAVQRGLRESGAASAGDADDADIVVRLADEREARRGVSLTPGGRVAEYEVSLQVSFVAEAANGEAIIPRRVVRAERVYSLDVNNLVGSREEEALIREELRRELAERIVRNLAAVANAR